METREHLVMLPFEKETATYVNHLGKVEIIPVG